MVFWRNRAAKKVEAPVIVEAEQNAEPSTPKEASAGTETATAKTVEAASTSESNIVPLTKVRLADRLADVAEKAPPAREIAAVSVIAPAEVGALPGQVKAIQDIREALASARPGEHLLILGAAGTGRMATALRMAENTTRPKSPDWIYVVDRNRACRAQAFALPAGKGRNFVSDASVAIEKASASLRRQLASDEHRLDVDLLNEEMRFRVEKAVDQVRRRAESQNIAVVKSLDGYVLAPMHEGRVVRSDVFHSLPESLKRNVEAKITALEAELQETVAALPGTETQIGEKFETLFRETAWRALKPFAGALLAAYGEQDGVRPAIEAIERAFVTWGTAFMSGVSDPIAVDVFAVTGEDAESDNATVVVAHEASDLDLVGRASSDSRGRLAIAPGHLARAGAGVVLVEAWKLAADPKAWMALSASLASGKVAPRCASRSAFEAESLMLAATVVVIADADSWAKLNSIEPGAVRHFRNVAKFAETAAPNEVAEAEFSGSAARLALELDVSELESATGPLLYKDAVKRGGGRVSLDRLELGQILRGANALAAADKSNRIRAADIAGAIASRAAAS